jgi:DNA-directed RNA polymerase subunit omega
MARVTVEDCLKNVDSRFTLVHLAVRRVLQLRGGAPLMLENIKSNKEVVMALREIAANKITVDTIRQIDEIRPVPVEPAAPEREIARVELKEILDEATAFSPSIEFEEPGEFLEPDQEQDQDTEGDEV